MPDKPKHVEEELKKFSKNKLPHFFKYAKDKEVDQVSSLNNSTVNKLYDIIPNKPIQFKKVIGYSNHKLMMKNKYPNHDLAKNEEVIERFKAINKAKGIMTKNGDYNDDGFNHYIKEELAKIYKNESYISDILVEYFFNTDSKNKETLWACYGEYIYENLLLNLENTFSCERCGKRYDGKVNEKLCEGCKKLKINESKAKYREKGKKSKR